MAANRYALIDAQGVKRNVTLWDADTNPEWTPPPGFTVVPDDGTPVISEPASQTTDESVSALTEAVEALLDNKPAKAAAALNRIRKK